MVARCWIRIVWLVVIAVSAVLVPLVPDARGSAAESTSGSQVTVLQYDCDPNVPGTFPVTVTATGPASARQGDTFVVEDVTFSFAVVAIASYQATGVVLPAALAGGSDLVSSGPPRPGVIGTYTTDSASGDYSVWGAIGDTMDFYAGDLLLTVYLDYPGVPPYTVGCGPVRGSAPVLSVVIEPPEDGGPITDEFGVRVVASDGTVLYERREFLESGDFVVKRNSVKAVERLTGSGTYESGGTAASVTVASGIPPGFTDLDPATVLRVSDAPAGVEVRAFSGLAHKSSGTRESVAGFALGVLEGYPAAVGVYWFVRDLA